MNNDKQMKSPGIYGIVNTLNDSVYVGSTRRPIRSRWIKHRRQLRKGIHFNPHLSAAWNKYGEDVFEFVVLETVTKRAELYDREQAWIDSMKKTRHVYNTQTPNVEWKEYHRSNEANTNIAAIMSENMAKSYPAFRNFYTEEMIAAGVNMTMMCRKRNLNRKALLLVKTGKGFSSQGWILEENWQRYLAGKLSQKEVECVDLLKGRSYPAFRNIYDGKRIPPGENLTKLCREQGLSQVGFQKIKRKEVFSNNGWILESNWTKAMRGAWKENAKLTWKDVRQIRASSLSREGLARQYGVCQTTIGRVRNHKILKRVPSVEALSFREDVI